jgi:hypothetical protein
MNTEDTPTVPGARPCIRRALNRTFDDMAFDTPVNAVTYVGVRKSGIKAKQRELSDAIDYAIMWGCVAACMALAVLTYILDFS